MGVCDENIPECSAPSYMDGNTSTPLTEWCRWGARVLMWLRTDDQADQGWLGEIGEQMPDGEIHHHYLLKPSDRWQFAPPTRL